MAALALPTRNLNHLCNYSFVSAATVCYNGDAQTPARLDLERAIVVAPISASLFWNSSGPDGPTGQAFVNDYRSQHGR